MIISVEISYYPLQKDFEKVVLDFLISLKTFPEIKIQEGVMSSLITGKYEHVMSAIEYSLKPFLEKYPSVFHLSISNACMDCKL